MKYEIEIERKQRSVVIETVTRIVESNIAPKVGDGKALLIDPPIYETVVSVREIK